MSVAVSSSGVSRLVPRRSSRRVSDRPLDRALDHSPDRSGQLSLFPPERVRVRRPKFAPHPVRAAVSRLGSGVSSVPVLIAAGGVGFRGVCAGGGDVPVGRGLVVAADRDGLGGGGDPGPRPPAWCGAGWSAVSGYRRRAAAAGAGAGCRAAVERPVLRRRRGRASWSGDPGPRPPAWCGAGWSAVSGYRRRAAAAGAGAGCRAAV